MVTEYLRIDKFIFLISLFYALLTFPLITQNTSDPQLLAAFSNDEPWQTMSLEGMTEKPFGNPANFLTAGRSIPEYWGSKRYDGIVYYGGSYLGIGYIIFSPLKALGFSTFPIAPVILRAISAIAGLFSIIILYNLSRRNSGTGAAVLCCTFMATEPSLLYYALTIHPDTLQLLFGLVAFIFAIEHSRKGTLGTLIGMGFMFGFVTGTKLGGPWLVPLYIFSIAIGMGFLGGGNENREIDKRRLAKVLFCIGGAAILAFAISTPYAFIDKYYISSMVQAGKIVTTNTLTKVNFFTWINGIYVHLGFIFSSFVLLALMRNLLDFGRIKSNPVYFLASVTSISQIIWFGLLGGLWVVVAYFLVAFSLLAFLVSDMIISLLNVVVSQFRLASKGRSAFLLILFLLMIETRGVPALFDVSQRYLNKSNTVVVLNKWARENVGRNSIIVHDDLAYFDIKNFPNAMMHGGVLTWPQIRRYQPDYIVLSSSLYDASWYQELRKTQGFDSMNEDPYSMRLYQDLLDTKTPGPTKIPGVSFVHEESAKSSESGNCKPVKNMDSAIGALEAVVWLGAKINNRLCWDLFTIHAAWNNVIQYISPSNIALAGPTLKVFEIRPRPLEWTRFGR